MVVCSILKSSPFDVCLSSCIELLFSLKTLFSSDSYLNQHLSHSIAYDILKQYVLRWTFSKLTQRKSVVECDFLRYFKQFVGSITSKVVNYMSDLSTPTRFSIVFSDMFKQLVFRSISCTISNLPSRIQCSIYLSWTRQTSRILNVINELLILLGFNLSANRLDV